MTTAAERLDRVRQECGIPTDADLGRWAKFKNPQNISTIRARGNIPAKAADRIAAVTGASTEWLQFDRGVPFPSGPKPFPGAKTPQLDQLDGRVTVAWMALARVMRVLIERQPGAAADVERALRAIPPPDGPVPELGTLVAAAEEVRLAEEQAARVAEHRESAGRPHRKGR